MTGGGDEHVTVFLSQAENIWCIDCKAEGIIKGRDCR
jgi:hypothetical protein